MFVPFPPVLPSSRRVRGKIELGGTKALTRKVDDEEPVEIYSGLKEEIGIRTYLHGPMNSTKKLRVRLRVGDLDLPYR